MCSFSSLRFSNLMTSHSQNWQQQRRRCNSENNQDIREFTYRIIATYLKFLSSHKVKQKMHYPSMQCFFKDAKDLEAMLCQTKSLGTLGLMKHAKKIFDI